MGESTCFMHVGTGKTGSTAVQFALRQKRRYLSQQGVDYPDFSKNLEIASTRRPTAGNGAVLYRKPRNGNVDGPIKIIRRYQQQRSFILSCEGFWLLP